ncbi:proton-coupled amino acid transporter-like protein pathetic isoform X2 [Aricia agestis]|uniref:proton-coupled amino acid transporter-like protein pathetic isoform X2 n=1 Tax=Aricia agestis TaxID=91739 RepID=UPI001C203F1D|nr:proton-coupled amino acid transporter-like protein pathetic isoform X2 [Aricia agestis]
MEELLPSDGGPGHFQNLAATQEEEDAFDFVKYRNCQKPSGVIGSTANMIKGALGGGILGGHVAYMKAGVWVAAPFHIIFGVYIGYCLLLLLSCAQIMNRRTRVPVLSYPDVGEAAMQCFPNKKVAKYSKIFRYSIDFVICLDLFGSCSVYQIMIAKTIKQLAENQHHTGLDGIGPGYPNLRVYMTAIIIPVILICLILHLKWLAPFSIVADVIIVICIFFAIYYAFALNPNFENMVPATTLYSYFEYVGMSVFSMSSAGVVIAIENNMKEPKRFPIVIISGMVVIVMCSFCMSFFGYVAFLDKCESPITLNFPLITWNKILKCGIAIMIYITHAVNFWVPFNTVFYYLTLYHKTNLLRWEYFYRVLFVVIIAIIAIIFPNIDALMGLLGALCLSCMAFIWPNFIYLLIIWERPGLGKYNWRFWRSMIMMCIGIFILVVGSTISGIELVSIYF